MTKQVVEWSARSKYNSFNSWKGLTYYENYKAIVKWLRHETGYLPPPVECNVDPIAECNLRCYFCITQRYLRHKRAEVGEMRRLDLNYLFRLVDFLAQWGVRGLCVSGGGDPSLHKGTPSTLFHAVRRGMQTSLFTNAVFLSDSLADAIMTCKWISLSIDASNEQEYRAIKGRSLFDKVVANMTKLAQLRAKVGSNVFLVFKFLILPENSQSIYKACKLAKELGLQAFHARPVDFQRSDIQGSKKLEIDIENVKEQFKMCHELEDENFRVFTVVHKFDPEFHVKHDFTQCLATPLVLPLLSDGNAYLCVDRKMERNYILGSCYPDPEEILNWWGSGKHRELIKSVNINNCSRCTWSQYNAQIENVVMKDSMYLSFP